MHLVVDVLLALAVVAAFVGGWRQGAFSAVISAVGIVAGLIVGLALAPFLLDLTDSQSVRIMLLLAVVVLFVGLGNLLGVTLGANMRGRVRSRLSRFVDSVLGAVFQSVAFTLVVWFISIPLAAAVPGELGDGIRNSRILAQVHDVAPDSAGSAASQNSWSWLKLKPMWRSAV